MINKVNPDLSDQEAEVLSNQLLDSFGQQLASIFEGVSYPEIKKPQVTKLVTLSVQQEKDPFSKNHGVKYHDRLKDLNVSEGVKTYIEEMAHQVGNGFYSLESYKFLVKELTTLEES